MILASTVILFASLSVSCGGSGVSPSDEKEVINADDQESPSNVSEDDGLINIEDESVSEAVLADSQDEQQDQQVEQTGTTEAEQVSLVIDSIQRCAVVSEPLAIVVTRRLMEGEDAAADDELPNVTGQTRFEQLFSDSLRLVSRTDEAANFEFVAQDIVGLTSSIDNGSVTTFLAGYNAEAPSSFIMRKPVPGGCLYAFKSGDYCVTGLTKSADLVFSRDGVSMTANACELQNPNDLALIDVPARDVASRLNY